MLFFNKCRFKKIDALCQYLKPITTKASSVLSLYSIVMSSDCILYLNVLLDKKRDQRMSLIWLYLKSCIILVSEE